MLTFNVVLGYQGILFQDFLWIFFQFFFFNPIDRPTQYQGQHSTLNEKKESDGLTARIQIPAIQDFWFSQLLNLGQFTMCR